MYVPLKDVLWASREAALELMTLHLGSLEVLIAGMEFMANVSTVPAPRVSAHSFTHHHL
jgi:hypothetical protein